MDVFFNRRGQLIRKIYYYLGYSKKVFRTKIKPYDDKATDEEISIKKSLIRRV